MASSRAHDSENTEILPSSSTMAGNTSTTEENPVELFPGCTSITDFSQTMLKTVVQATKTSNELPTGDDYDYYSTYDSVRNVMDMEARRLLHLLQSVMRHHNVKGTISGTDHALELDEQFDVIMDANDQILERVATSVDEATGVRKNEQKLVVTAVNRPNPAVASWNKKRSTTGSSPTVQLLTARNIPRPQLSFRDKIDNSNKPFVPIIRRKPHAKKSLQESLQLPPGISLEDTENADFVYPHPYQVELDEWQPSPDQLEKVVPQEPKPLADTPAQFIDTVSDLAELCDLLAKEKEVAVDLEHHSYRTFQGFVCLMQISTRHKDFLIDTLALRSDMYMLNEVFADPAITKVFHGADSDIEWLQRDFGLYVVNMFDTGQAARVLQCARFSLAHLLHVYCQVEADKQYQLSDWRMRPLPDKMARYAQEDTHYLLYIYDRMRNELLERGNEQRNLLQSVYQRSTIVCLKVYKKPRLTNDSHLDLYLKSKKAFNAQQLRALKDIYAWRDKMARDEDESMQYVLPNHMLLQMAEILPRERQGVLACCNPIPPLVRQCQHELHHLILQARETTLAAQVDEKKAMLEPSALQHPQYHTPLTTCPHDLSKQGTHLSSLDPLPTHTDGVPTKSRSSLFHRETDIPLKKRPILSALDVEDNSNRRGANSIASKVHKSLVSPFVRFLPVVNGAQDGIVKPQIVAKPWRLKQHTETASQKRKSDIDLNTFAPEFAPPAKKLQAGTNASKTTTASASKPHQPSTNATTSSTASSTTISDEPMPSETREKKKTVAEEETPLSSQQLMKKKKKERKANQKVSNTDPPAASTQPPSTPLPAHTPGEQSSSSCPSTPLTKEEKKQKKKKKEKLKNSLAAESELSTTTGVSEGDQKKKKKKKKEKANVSLAAELTTTVVSAETNVAEEKKKKKKKKENTSSVTGDSEPKVDTTTTSDDTNKSGEKKKKKKKENVNVLLDVGSQQDADTSLDAGEKKKKRKKKKTMVGEVAEESITPFDYSAADKSTVTGKVKKVHADVYNPNFRGGAKRQKKGKKERFGAKQRKSSTFAGSTGSTKKRQQQ